MDKLNCIHRRGDIMLKYSWKSRKLYNINGNCGRIIYSDELGRYLLCGTNDREFIIDQKFAENCREIENRLNRNIGRPRIFTDDKTTARLITLPDMLWDKIGAQYSANIAKIIESHYTKSLNEKTSGDSTILVI